MTEVTFYDEAEEARIKYAVVVARSGGKWVFCKHKERSTLEFPGGHREIGEAIDDTAKRELYEETGAVDYCLNRIGPYSVCQRNGAGETVQESFGMLYYCEIFEFGKLPEEFEMERIQLFDDPPGNWTYPDIQPALLKRAREYRKAVSQEKVK